MQSDNQDHANQAVICKQENKTNRLGLVTKERRGK